MAIETMVELEVGARVRRPASGAGNPLAPERASDCGVPTTSIHSHLSLEETESSTADYDIFAMTRRLLAVIEGSPIQPPQSSEDLHALAYIAQSLEDIEATIWGITRRRMP